MRKLLGQTGYSWNAVIEIQDNKIVLPDTSAEIDNAFNQISSVIKEIYPEEQLVIEENAVHINFVKYGSIYSLVKDDTGLYFKVTQPVYHNELSDLKERFYYVIPKIEGGEYDIDLESSYVNISTTVYNYTDWQCNSYVGKTTKQSLINNDYIYLGSVKVRCGGWKYPDYYKDVFFKVVSSNFNGTKLNMSFNISLMFFEELIVVDYKANENFDIYFNLEEIDYVISPMRVDSAQPYQTAEDALSAGGTLKIITPEKLPRGVKHNDSTKIVAEIGEFNGTIDSLIPQNGYFKILELSSITEPKYKIETIEGDASQSIGKVVYVIDSKNSKYEVFMVSGYEQDDENEYIVLDNYITLDLNGSDVYCVYGVSKDYAFRYKNKVFEDDVKDFVIWKEVTRYEVTLASGVNLYEIKLPQFVSWDTLKNIVLSDGTTLGERLGFVFNKPRTFGEKYDTILPIPLFPVSQEDYNKTTYTFNSLSYDIIDTIPGIAVLKPTLLGTPHPSGSGYAIVAKVPNLYAIDIESYLKYTPSKIFVNAEDTVVSNSAYVASFVKKVGNYSVYAVLGLVKGTTKPFKVIEF